MNTTAYAIGLALVALTAFALAATSAVIAWARRRPRRASRFDRHSH